MNFNKYIIDRPNADTRQSRAIEGRQIQGKTSNQTFESLFCDSGTLLLLFTCHIRSYHHSDRCLTS